MIREIYFNTNNKIHMMYIYIYIYIISAYIIAIMYIIAKKYSKKLVYF